MIEKLQTAGWFARRPSHWPHAVGLAVRKFRPNYDSPEHAAEATNWAASRAVPLQDALASMGLLESGQAAPVLPAELIDEGHRNAERSAVKMGGPGDLDLLYSVCKLSGAGRIVETGVAYGWSSLAILAAIDGRANAKLVSVDMPYPKMNNDAFVGVAVPDRLRSNWQLIREPDRRGLEKAISAHGGTIDLCHYDSDKSWWGRQYGFQHLWKALAPGGVFISDDIQDNMAFAEFVDDQDLTFAVTESDGKYVGICRKPS